MSTIKASELVAFVKKAAADGWKYVGGANGEFYTKFLAEKWAATRTGRTPEYYLETCKDAFGHYAADCSGLIIAAMRSKDAQYQDQTANTLYSRCSEKGAIKAIPEIPGLCVWKTGHIGVYIGGGYAVEARSTAYDVVTTKLTARPWTNWGKLADVDYLEMEDEIMLQKRTSPMQYSAEDEALQKALNRHGANLKVDGKFGKNTEEAVKAFQKSKGLPQTGVVDTKTAAALWNADGEANAGSIELTLKIGALNRQVESLQGHLRQFLKLADGIKI